jgi:hypothetical protein
MSQRMTRSSGYICRRLYGRDTSNKVGNAEFRKYCKKTRIQTREPYH